MSKELEALDRLIEQIELNTNYDGVYIDKEIIEQALTPPTQEKVCEALSEYYGKEVVYEDNEFRVYDLRNQKTWGRQNRYISLDELYDKPHLITMIGRFYEGETK